VASVSNVPELWATKDNLPELPHRARGEIKRCQQDEVSAPPECLAVLLVLGLLTVHAVAALLPLKFPLSMTPTKQEHLTFSCLDKITQVNNYAPIF
jgi:hypothetical protein